MDTLIFVVFCFVKLLICFGEAQSVTLFSNCHSCHFIKKLSCLLLRSGT